MFFVSLGFASVPPQALGHSGFVTPDENFQPSFREGKRFRDIQIANPSQSRIIIFSHGQSRESQMPDCKRPSNDVPKSLLMLESKNTKVYYLCSKSWGGGEKGYYIYKRVEEIRLLLEKFESLGVSKDRIVLTGHSAGGWASLMSQSLLGSDTPRVIAFAPAFAGLKSEEAQYPEWRRVARPKHVRQLETGASIRALIFAYIGDGFEEPNDLMFLEYRSENSVEIVGYNCQENQNQHRNHLNDCRLNSTVERIRNYLDHE